MFHHSPTVTEAAPVAPHWRAAVAVGDIIRWPLDGTTEGLGLIVEVEHIAGWPVLTVAPGVADVSQPVSPGTLRLIRLDEVRQSGLPLPYGSCSACGSAFPPAILPSMTKSRRSLAICATARWNGFTPSAPAYTP